MYGIAHIAKFWLGLCVSLCSHHALTAYRRIAMLCYERPLWKQYLSQSESYISVFALHGISLSKGRMEGSVCELMNKSSHTTEEIYQEIRNRILRNEIPPNAKINQKDLALELGVSRTPVIKALHMLEADGLVDNVPNRGFYFHVTTLRELSELFTLRQSLEMIAAMHAAEHGTEESFAQLHALFQPFIDATEIDYDRYYYADQAFHSAILQMCDNSLMHKINDSLQIMERAFSFGLLRPPAETLQEHLNIIEALRSRDAVKAQDVARAHTEITKRSLQNAENQMRRIGLNPDKLSVFDVFKK